MAEKEIKYITDTFDNVRFSGGYSGFYPSTFLGRLLDLETQSGIGF